MDSNSSDQKIMLDTDNYQERNMLQREHALATLLEYSPKMLWRSDGQDTILDIGCAEGAVTEKVLEPLVPKDYKVIVGIDLKEELINLAQKRNKNKRIMYKTMDISGDIDLDMDKFDHITSFLCLHWVDDKRKAFENIYNLLAEGGDCLLTLVPNHNYQKIVKIMSLMDQWKHCFKDQDLEGGIFEFEPNPEESLRKIIEDVGFKYHQIKTKPWTYDHKDMEAYRDFVKMFNPIHDCLSGEKYENYIDDFLEIIWMLEDDPSKKPITRGDFVTIYARK